MVDKSGYNFSWIDPVTLDCDTKFSSDKLGRARYAEFLTHFLVGEAQNGYVLNLNSGWGTGKTYFLKRWQHSINVVHPTVYIDAWKQDFSNDPMLAVISSIISQLRDQSKGDVEQKIINIGSKAWGFCKQATPEITKAVVKKLSGVDVDKVVEKNSESNLFESKDFADASGKLVSAIIKDHDAKLKSIKDFKDSIAAFINDILSCTEKDNPTFIFIDELDRCRPTYAVEMLEVIKHFFDMPNVIFVVATDTEQLQHAVKAVYGNDFNANVYLSRFFQRRCTLQEQPRLEFIQNKLSSLEDSQLTHFNDLVWPFLDNDVEYLSYLVASIADVFSLPLRETEQLVDKVKAVLFTVEDKKVDILLLCSLMIIHDRYFEFYQDIINGRRAKGQNGMYYEPKVIQDILFKEDYSINVELNLQPYNFFEDGKFIARSTNYNINITNGKHSVSYTQLLSTQLISCHSSTSNNKFKAEITSIIQRGNNSKPPISNYVGVELIELNQSKSDYKNWVELATSFDS
ncbi:KAP family NTPase [Shewanella sp. 10N.7]|uniref:KAP family P-loop NTPase fold protein n=1 Tax=Shewanella sp. 10N.7 TaxID=2885093 RepID=UPI001E44A07C|nr:P-loop NTPase fold protein [Shewanella sp. 10N.7]MCC4832741.1 KAP family NTPase [Shewanella sp. 10N.7]